MSQTVYLIDTNAFLHPSKQYYQFNFAPSFWQQLNEHFISGRVITLDKVWDEICVADEEEKKMIYRTGSNPNLFL